MSALGAGAACRTTATATGRTGAPPPPPKPKMLDPGLTSRAGRLHGCWRRPVTTVSPGLQAACHDLGVDAVGDAGLDRHAHRGAVAEHEHGRVERWRLVVPARACAPAHLPPCRGGRRTGRLAPGPAVYRRRLARHGLPLALRLPASACSPPARSPDRQPRLRHHPGAPRSPRHHLAAAWPPRPAPPRLRPGASACLATRGSLRRALRALRRRACPRAAP